MSTRHPPRDRVVRVTAQPFATPVGALEQGDADASPDGLATERAVADIAAACRAATASITAALASVPASRRAEVSRRVDRLAAAAELVDAVVALLPSRPPPRSSLRLVRKVTP